MKFRYSEKLGQVNSTTVKQKQQQINHLQQPHSLCQTTVIRPAYCCIISQQWEKCQTFVRHLSDRTVVAQVIFDFLPFKIFLLLCVVLRERKRWDV